MYMNQECGSPPCFNSSERGFIMRNTVFKIAVAFAVVLIGGWALAQDPNDVQPTKWWAQIFVQQGAAQFLAPMASECEDYAIPIRNDTKAPPVVLTVLDSSPWETGQPYKWHWFQMDVKGRLVTIAKAKSAVIQPSKLLMGQCLYVTYDNGTHVISAFIAPGPSN
jgi:hypothetical protein